MLKTAILASGSSGNCAAVSDGRTHILIDAGISARRITAGLRALELDPNDIMAQFFYARLLDGSGDSGSIFYPRRDGLEYGLW